MPLIARGLALLLKSVDVAVWLITAAYPFLVWLVLEHWSPRWVALLLALLLLLRWWRSGRGSAQQVLPWLGLLGAGFLLAVAWINQTGWLLAYPVVVSLAFFTVFSLSLVFPPTVVERLARLQDPDLPPAGVAYTRKVTVVWSVFFVLNAMVSLITVVSDDHRLWTLYNGVVFYVLMGLLMGIEMLVRRKAKARFYPK